MPFYKFKFLPLSQPCEVVEIHRVVDTVMLGENISKEVSFKNVDITSVDYVSDIPMRDEYTLENLLSAGVPLEVIKTNHMLDKQNDADMERLAHVKISSVIENNKEILEQSNNNVE